MYLKVDKRLNIITVDTTSDDSSRGLTNFHWSSSKLFHFLLIINKITYITWPNLRLHFRFCKDRMFLSRPRSQKAAVGYFKKLDTRQALTIQR